MLEKRGESWQERIPQAAVTGTYVRIILVLFLYNF